MSTAILLSGGMDSISIAYWLRPEFALTIDYGQRSAVGEMRAATHVTQILGISHEVLRLDCSSLGSGDLAGTPPHPNAPVREWWPYRNQLLVTIGAMMGMKLGIRNLLIGSVKSDSIHADGTSTFYEAVNSLLALQEGEMHVLAPAIDLTTTELIRTSEIPLSLLAWAHSCHTGEFACGHCRGCQKHMNVTEELWNHAF